MQDLQDTSGQHQEGGVRRRNEGGKEISRYTEQRLQRVPYKDSGVRMESESFLCNF